MDSGGFFNLSTATALVVDDVQQSLDILAGVLSSFGTKQVLRAESGEEATRILDEHEIDLVMTDAQMPQMDGYDLVRWIRRSPKRETKITPAVIVTAHTRQSDVLRARDCGANFIIAKPITPRVVLDRILWVGRADRMFVETDNYIGPDRRYKRSGPPPEFPNGRRRDDVPAEIAGAGENLSLDELDQMVRPQKASV